MTRRRCKNIGKRVRKEQLSLQYHSLPHPHNIWLNLYVSVPSRIIIVAAACWHDIFKVAWRILCCRKRPLLSISPLHDNKLSRQSFTSWAVCAQSHKSIDIVKRRSIPVPWVWDTMYALAIVAYPQFHRSRVTCESRTNYDYWIDPP